MTNPSPALPRHIDEDESFFDWARAHGRQLSYGAIGAVALVVVTLLVRQSNETNELSASRALADAQRSVASGNLPLAAADLQKMTTRYGSTRAGIEARLLLAKVQLEQGKTDDALKLLDNIGGAGALESSVHALRAGALEQAGKPAEAAASYLKAAAATNLGAEAESFRSDAARAWVAAGKKDEALKIWEVIAANPASVLYNEAQLRIGELSAAAVK